jgi:hypothetical protein
LADLLSQVRREIDTRLSQLRPVLEEFRRLEQAREALSTADGGSRRQPRRGGGPKVKRTRMTKLQREIDRGVLALLAEDPAQRPAALAMLTETSVGSMNSRLPPAVVALR